MKKAIVLIFIGLYSNNYNAQEFLKNALSTSFVRMEGNTQTINGGLHLKFITGIGYQRYFGKWTFGLKHEHGLNKITEDCENCYDHLYGIGYMREDNLFLKANFTILDLFDSKIELKTGVGFYYSNLNYSGNFQGGTSGLGSRQNSTYNSIGFNPNIQLIYNVSNRFFLSLNTSIRYGWSNVDDKIQEQTRKLNETVVTIPECKIGVKF